VNATTTTTLQASPNANHRRHPRHVHRHHQPVAGKLGTVNFLDNGGAIANGSNIAVVGASRHSRHPH